MNELLRDWLLDPLALLFLSSLVLGAFLGGNTIRTWLVLGIWVMMFLTVSAPAIVNPLLGTLEDRFADESTETDGCESASAIVVLGGGIDSRARRVDDYGAMTPGTFARVTATFELAMRRPENTVIVSGGGRAAVTEASMMRGFLIQLGVSESRIIAEDESRNTRENAERVADVLQGLPGVRTAMLVTSALHMPRAVGDFRSVGIEVCPVPVDRLRIREVPPWALMPQTSALRKFDLWLHEAVALLVYRFR